MAEGAWPTVVYHPTLSGPMQPPPKPVAAAAAAADVWFDFASAYQLYSPAYVSALEAGCIYVCLASMDVDMMVRTIGRTCPSRLQQMADLLYAVSQEASVVRVEAPGGTNLCMEIDKAGDPFWEPPREGHGWAQMLCGQSGFMAYRESYEGVLVFDGCIWPPDNIGVLQSPVELTIRGGLVTDVSGGFEARIFKRWLADAKHPEAYRIDHTCYGFNPGVTRPTGRIVEDERVFGCLQFGIGASTLGSPTHTDGVVLSPTIWLDDTALEEDGVYVHPELREICRSMAVPGY